ncbi:DUF1631 family protein [Duganella sp. BJB488]|uniref:DUF1631 family protein n=1 Tax=unclassified Duganella TaxID=2636909 RepID=UPI000E34A151|nr:MULTISPECIES: DUF1631 family protein [unclassified Duganella]RFP10302.1 DUF1631 family protein [Duganella sp. BJB489]RFP18103.1 DUF1631 family protein [Duganella sp. BJB488]RFP37860.1 DUF1631 family protein [Duganella sp. BJB480]
MVASSTTPPVPKKTVSPRHALLEELIGIATRHAGDQYLDLATRLAGALIDATGGDPRTMQQRIRAGNQLRNRNFAFLHLASSTLEKALRREIAELSPAAKGKPRASEQPLSLVPFEEMDNKVALSGVSKPFESLYSDQLQTLNVRLAFLLDRDILRVSQNPFRPEVFLVALQQAWTEFDTEADAAPLLQPLIKPGMFIELGPMLDALNLALQSKGVLPGSVDGFKGRKTDKPKAAAPSRVRGNQAALAQQLRQFFASSDVAGSAAGEIVDNIADGLMQGVDLSIPDLPMSALNSGAVWVPNVAAGQAAVGAAGAAGAVAHGAALPVGSRDAAQGFVPAAVGTPGSVLMAPGFAVGMAGAPAAAGGGFLPAGAGQGGAWVQGPAQGLVAGALSNEDAQRLSQIGAKQPLLAYLAQLQKAVPYESIGTLGAVAGMAAVPSPSAPADVGAGAVPGAAAAGGNVFYLPNIKASMPQGSLSRTDESTIDLLSAIFDTVFRDQNISQEIRDLIRFLQIPVLKAALVDKNFFFQEAHPARRLIDLLSRMGWEQRKGPEDPLFQAMQRSVDRVGRDYDHELSVFTEAVNELEASIQAEERAAAAAIAEPIAAALKQEKMAESSKLARNAVALRIGTGEVIAVVEAFLEQRWVSVLTIAYSIEDDKPGAVNNATKTMDDLIWSVRPKLNAEDRKQLIAKLPVLLSTLNKWLDIIKWQDADRLQFFAELAECHASIVRAPLEISPERQLEISMQVAQQAAERRLELQAKAEAAAKAEAEARAAQQPAPEEEDAAIEVDSLTRGMWLEFEQEDGGSRKVKLAWISPLRTLYIFSTAARQEAFSMSGEQLAKRFLEQTVQVVRSEGVVAVALSQALARNADNDANIDPPASAFG